MQDRNSGALEEHPALAISRTLKDDYEDLFDTISVKNDDYGRTVYAHVDIDALKLMPDRSLTLQAFCQAI